ncbi:MAG: hypothetical protein IJW32_02015 [Clostridia bacterium]|nr:hypothetical protein [Clostridia bacterium]
MAKKKEEKQKFGDIIENHELIKRTLMVAAFPGLIKETVKNGKKSYEGFLPGFEFAQVDNIADENEIVETLQDMLDDEVEELVVFGKSLPYVDEDEVLMEKYPEHKIVYLDINVYATAEELEYYDACSHDCAHCAHSEECLGDDEYDDCDCEDCCDDDCDCEDDVCCCGHDHHEHYHHHHDHCDCGCEDEEDDCCCDDDCDCEEDDECCCGHDHKHEECGCNHEHHDCKCKDEEKKDHKCNCENEGKPKGNCKKKK